MKSEIYWYSIFRIIIGVLFILHGAMKFGKGIPASPLFLAAGIIEIVGGTLITLGLWTRLVAAITAIEMGVAYFMAHAPKGLSPLGNGGEAAVLFFVAFLVLLVHGGGKFTIEHLIRKKEFF
jgi:putative oxidoreductase